jgi:hypothetical protein
VILHKAYVSDEQAAFTHDALGEPIYEDEAIALFDAPEAEAAPEFAALTNGQLAIERYADSYLYAPQTGWVNFSGTLQADGRMVELSLDQQVIQRWQVDSTLDFNVPLPVQAGAYHVVRLALNPPCPAVDDPALECRAVAVSNLVLAEPITGDSAEATFDRGVRLLRGTVEEQEDEALTVRLSWAFDAALSENDIRFVHVVGADGTPVVQDDRTLGVQAAGSTWVENVALTLPDDLPLGTYRVYVGWYTYPDFIRFAVEGAPDGLVLLGEITIGE